MESHGVRSLPTALKWSEPPFQTTRPSGFDSIAIVPSASYQSLPDCVLNGFPGLDRIPLLRGPRSHARTANLAWAELHFQLPLVNAKTGEVLDVPFRGVIDLVEDGDILDEFKTSQKSWSASDLPDNVQLTAYAYAYQMLLGRPPKALRLINLIRTKNVKIEPMTTERGEQDYVRLFHLRKEVLKGVTSQVFIPNRSCWLCKDCEYDRDCREWTGNEQ